LLFFCFAAQKSGLEGDERERERESGAI